MNGYEYEELCAKFLRKSGFKNVEVTSGSGDQGIDVIGYKDKKKYGIQCKCYEGTVGNKAVQEAYSGAAYYECDVAVVMTDSRFSAPARELADSLDVVLWENLGENEVRNQWIINGAPQSQLFYRLNIICAVLCIVIAAVEGYTAYGYAGHGQYALYDMLNIMLQSPLLLVAGGFSIFDGYRPQRIVIGLIFYVLASIFLGFNKIYFPFPVFVVFVAIICSAVIVVSTRLIASTVVAYKRIGK